MRVSITKKVFSLWAKVVVFCFGDSKRHSICYGQLLRLENKKLGLRIELASTATIEPAVVQCLTMYVLVRYVLG